MTSNESFKKRIRARMAATGEKYNAARRVLIEQAQRRTGHGDDERRWVARPELSDDAVRDATGRGWDEWVDLVEEGPVATDGHTAVARWLREHHGLDGWWSQSVTGGWERITGRRLPGQMPDGSFTVNRSRTLPAAAPIDRSSLRAMLLDDDERGSLFPGMDTELRSAATARTLRIAMPVGLAQIAVETRDDDRVRVSVAHERLPVQDEVEPWRAFWGDWLAALDG